MFISYNIVFMCFFITISNIDNQQNSTSDIKFVFIIFKADKTFQKIYYLPFRHASRYAIRREAGNTPARIAHRASRITAKKAEMNI